MVNNQPGTYQASWDGAIETKSLFPPCENGSSPAKGCKCVNCLARQNHYNRTWRRRKAERAWGNQLPTDKVDPEPAVKAVWDAHSVRGVSFEEIARVTGISSRTVSDLYRQKRKTWITRSLSDRILAAYGPDVPYTPREYADNQLIDFQPYRQKILSLLAQDWRLTDLAAILEDAGRPTGYLRHIQDHNLVTWRNAQHIEWLVKQIGDRKGPAKCNAVRMAKRGIFPLIHYTEDGQLIYESLTPEQRARWRRVQS